MSALSVSLVAGVTRVTPSMQAVQRVEFDALYSPAREARRGAPGARQSLQGRRPRVPAARIGAGTCALIDGRMGSHGEDGPLDALSSEPPTETAASALATQTSPQAPGREATIALGAMVHQYEIIRVLGAGGMGRVLLARDTRLGRLAALKFLLTPKRAENAERFFSEARVTAQLSHENVVVIYEVGEYGGHPFMALEYVKGETLWHWIAARKARKGDAEGARELLVPPRRAVELMIPVVRALSHAHERGIVHRDLKPPNVMLADSGIIKVLDFGIAKLMAEVRGDAARGAALSGLGDSPFATQRGAGLGTVRYMAPEQWGIDDVDPRTDLWAVGLMLYELLFGESPLAPLVRAGQGVAGLAPLIELDTPLVSLRATHPELGKLGSIIDRCLIKRKQDRIGSADELLAQLLSTLPAAVASAVNAGEEPRPFAGLAAFQESDADRFFGRERMVLQGMGRLLDQPLLTVVGPSGAGKSSFVRAGLIPALKQSGDAWEAFILRPGPRPLVALSALLLDHSWQGSSYRHSVTEIEATAAEHVEERDALSARLSAEPGYLGAQLRSRARRRRERILLFIDQFEEAFTLTPEAERRALFACLSGVADDAGSPLRVVLSLRSDFLDRLVEAHAALPELGRSLFLLPPMDRSELRDALVRPLSALGYSFDPPDLVDTMLDAVAQTRDALPLLQFTATRLWELRDVERRALTLAGYRHIGGVAGTLARHADAVLRAMAPTEKQLARAALLRLVTPERTRAVVALRELRELGPSREAIEPVLDRLIAARLLTIEGSGEDDGTVEIVHESLIAHWPTLTKWLDESQGDAEFLSRLRAAAHAWRARGEREALLWRGEEAEEAQRFHERHRGELGQAEARFLRAVLAREGRDRRRRRVTTVGVITAALLVAAAMASLALGEARANRAAQEQKRRAEGEWRRAEGEKQLTVQEAMRARDAARLAAGQTLLGTNPTAAFVLLREIEQATPPTGFQDLLRKAVRAGVARSISPGSTAHPLAPDRVRVEWNSLDRTLRAWLAGDAAEPLTLQGQSEAVRTAGAIVSADKQYLAVPSTTRTAVWVWRTDQRAPPIVHRSTAPCSTFAFSLDSRRIAAACDDKAVRIWDVEGRNEPVVRGGFDDEVWGLAISPDGVHIAGSSRDRTVRIVRVDRGDAPKILGRHDREVLVLAFSPDGRRVVGSSVGNDLRVWDVEGHTAPRILYGPPMRWLGWSPDGGQILARTEDENLWVWDAEPPDEAIVLGGHMASVESIAWSPDGRRLASASSDHTLRIWQAEGRGEPAVLKGHEAEVYCVAWSPDGRRLASASIDKSLRVWDVDSGRARLVIRGHDDIVEGVAFSPDGRRLASASHDKTVRLWNPDNGSELLVLRGHEDAVHSVAFSSDGRHLASASRDKTVRLWDIDSGREPIVLRGHEGSVRQVAFRPDGRRLASVSADMTVRVWDTGDGHAITVLHGHEASIWSVAWSPDGQRLASASGDTTVRVWDVDGGSDPVVLRGPEGPILSVAWSPDGLPIASGATDRTVRIDRDLEPFALDSPQLWARTSACFSAELRRSTLGVSLEQAKADQARCERKVAEVGAGR